MNLKIILHFQSYRNVDYDDGDVREGDDDGGCDGHLHKRPTWMMMKRVAVVLDANVVAVVLDANVAAVEAMRGLEYPLIMMRFCFDAVGLVEEVADAIAIRTKRMIYYELVLVWDDDGGGSRR